MGEAGFIPKADQGNWWLYDKLRKTVRRDIWMELIPRSVGDGTVYPPQGCWEEEGKTSKAKKRGSSSSSDDEAAGPSQRKKKRNSASKVKRFKVPNVPEEKERKKKNTNSRKPLEPPVKAKVTVAVLRGLTKN